MATVIAGVAIERASPADSRADGHDREARALALIG
jgi:hypothetical protein